MPALSAGDLTKLRTTTHATKLALVVYNPASVLTCQVNGAQTTGARAITVDNVATPGTANKHYQVLFGSGAGLRDLGEARFISYSSGTLNVSAHNTPLADNTHITVKEEIKPQSIHVAIDDNDVVSEDGNEAYGSSYNSQYIPLARCGTHAVGYLDPTTGKVRISFYQRSTAIASGATIASHLWTWAGGTVITGSTTTAGTSGAPNVVEWDTAGDYYCSYTVTDSNSKTHTRYFVVFIRAYDAANVYTNLEISGMEGDVSTGVWRASLNVATSAGASAFPSRALCVLFAEDWFGATKTSIGSLNDVYRENIVLVGYIRRDTTRADWAKTSVTFEIESLSGVMENAWGLAGGVETSATPAGWHQLYNMNFNTAVHHVITRHATISHITDCYLSLPSYTIEYLDIEDASITDGLRNMIAPVRGRLGCNAQGHWYFEANPQLTSLAGRSTTYTIQTANVDLRDAIEFSDEGFEKIVSQVDFAGEDANADPVFSLAPANPWTTGHSEKLDAIRVDGQTQSNEFAGLYEGYFNNAFADVTINWRGNYRALDIFPAEPIAVNIAATQNARGIAWSTQRCWIKRVAYEYSGNNLRVTTIVEKDSYGSPGITGEYPVTPPIIDPGITPPPIIDPPPIVPPGEKPKGIGARVYVSSANGVARGDNATFPTGDYTWTAINSGLSTAAAKNVYGINFDPFSHDGTQFTKMWAMTEAGLYLCSGLDGSPTWSAKLTTANVETLLSAGAGTGRIARLFSPSVLTQNQIVTLVASDPGAGRWTWYWCYSNDNGATWTVDTSKWYVNNGASETNNGSIAPSFRTAGVYYLIGCGMQTDNTYYPSNYPSPTPAILKCATVSAQFIPAYGNSSYTPVNGAPTLFPFCNSAGVGYADDNVAFVHVQGMASGADYVQRFSSLFVPAWSAGYTPPTSTARGNLNMNSTNGLTGIFCNPFNENAIVAFNTIEVFASQSGGVTWNYYSTLPQNARSIYLVPSVEDSFFMAGDSTSTGYASVNYTLDGGATWTRIDNPLGGTLDSALSLSATTQMQSAIVLVDYYKV